MRGKTRVIFRADGNNQIGLGHVVRSLALAEMLCHDFECVFAIQAPSVELQEQIKQTCDGVIILPACLPDEPRFAHELNAYIAEDVLVVLDGYNFNTTYQQSIKSKGCQLLCIDDIHSYKFVADAILNQAGGVDARNYRTAAYTKLLLGPQYALLRPPFLHAAKTERAFPAGDVRVFLNLGGADPQNRTLQLAQELKDFQSINQVEIVVGSAYTYLHELKAWAADKPKYKLHQNLSAEEMCKLMQECAIAITSASGVAYEYASVGGLLFTLQTADNQEGLYTFLVQNGIAKEYGQLADLLQKDLEPTFPLMVASQRQYLDGKSSERLKQVLYSMDLAASTKIREVNRDDMMLLFDWANDPEVRRHSFNPNPILLETHKNWFETKLNDKNTALYIAETNGVPSAHVRFELNGCKATISYLLSSSIRGKGMSHVVLQKSISKLLRQNPVLNLIDGLVQQENTASIKAIKKTGFVQGEPDPKYPQAYRFELHTESHK